MRIEGSDESGGKLEATAPSLNGFTSGFIQRRLDRGCGAWTCLRHGRLETPSNPGRARGRFGRRPGPPAHHPAAEAGGCDGRSTLPAKGYSQHDGAECHAGAAGERPAGPAETVVEKGRGVPAQSGTAR